MTDDVTATVSMDGDEQIVRLPEAFRLSSSEVRLRRDGESLVLEPIRPRMSQEEIGAILADLKRMAAEDGPFMPEGREQPPMPDDEEPNPFDALP